ncbi:MAG TPA: hypothetical protein VHQ24_01515 [Lachnospiraceae bacterium]|nr:hypothetical protein [Lachnospiraceae bacterium]
MQKAEALERFLQQEVKEASKRFLLSSMDHLKKEGKQEKIEVFVKDFQTLLRTCREKEENGVPVRYLQISLVRSKALCWQPFYTLEAFGDMFYLTEPIASKESSLYWLYQEFEKFCRTIESESRRYVRKIGFMELERIKLAELITCNKIVKHMLNESLVYIINLEEFRELDPLQGIQIQMGEYRGPFETIFETNEYTEKIGRWWHGIL